MRFRCTYLGVFVFLFVISVGLLPFKAEAKISSIRAGVQPKGLRLVVDLSKRADYSYASNGKFFTLIVKDSSEEAMPHFGYFPGSKIKASYHVEFSDSTTKILIDLGKESMGAHVYELDNPSRIVVDFYPSGQKPPYPLQTFYFGKRSPFGSLGLRRSPYILSDGKLGKKFLLFQEELLIKPGVTRQIIDLDLESSLARGEEAILELNISCEGVRADSRSHIVVFLNGYPEKCFMLHDSKSPKKVLKVPLEKKRLKKGINKLEILSFIDGPTGWLKISKTSNLSILSYSERPLTLSDLGELLTEKEKFKDKILLVMPENQPLEVYKTALYIAIRSKARIKFKSLSSLLKQVNSGADFSKDDIIFLGLELDFPGYVRKAFMLDEKKEKNVFLSCFRNKAGRVRLLITAKDKFLLQKAVKFLFSEVPAELPAVSSLSLKDKDLREYFLGARSGTESCLIKIPLLKKEVVIRDALDERLTFTFLLPHTLEKIAKGKMLLRIRTSPFISLNQSEVQVEIKGHGRTSRKLNEASRIGDTIGFLVPVMDYDISSDDSLDMVITFHMKSHFGNTTRPPSSVMWVAIDELLFCVEDFKSLGNGRLHLEDLPFLWAGGEIGVWDIPMFAFEDLNLLAPILKAIENKANFQIDFFLTENQLKDMPKERVSGIVLIKMDELRGKDRNLHKFWEMTMGSASYASLHDKFPILVAVSAEGEDSLMVLFFGEKARTLPDDILEDLFREWNFKSGAMAIVSKENGDYVAKSLQTPDSIEKVKKGVKSISIFEKVPLLLWVVVAICFGLILLFLVLSFKNKRMS